MQIINWVDISENSKALPFAGGDQLFGDWGMNDNRQLGLKAQATRTRVEKAACRLFVAQGITETTTKDIAAEAEVSEGTIYRYFATKEELAFTLFSEIHTRLADAVTKAHTPFPGIADKTRAIIRAYCTQADKDWLHFSYHLLAQHMMLRHLPDDHPNPNAIATGLIEAAIKQGEIPERNAQVLTSALLGLVLQPAIAKIYGHDTGLLSSHADWLGDAAVRILEG